ncbi:hypothetical protein BDN72DRAFT_779086, partial [Pluteus cervinus]
LIAHCRAKARILQLKEGLNANGHGQRGMKGHTIIYPQKPETLENVLPPKMDDVVNPVCVLFVGSHRPSMKWLKERGSPLWVRADRVRKVLYWLRKHNHLYKNVVIDENRLNELPSGGTLPINLESVDKNEGIDARTARYDDSTEQPEFDGIENEESSQTGGATGSDIMVDSACIADVDINAPGHEIKTAAIRHVYEQKKAFLQMPRGMEPERDFRNPHLFLNMYPTYGIGTFGDNARVSSVSLPRQAKHYFSLSDHRFQEHYSFLFAVFNVLQKRAVFTRTGIRVRTKLHMISNC